MLLNADNGQQGTSSVPELEYIGDNIQSIVGQVGRVFLLGDNAVYSLKDRIKKFCD